MLDDHPLKGVDTVLIGKPNMFDTFLFVQDPRLVSVFVSPDFPTRAMWIMGHTLVFHMLITHVSKSGEDTQTQHTHATTMIHQRVTTQ